RLHNLGFDHPDLYSKHVLVDRDTGAFFFLDWQRSCGQRLVRWRQRWRDLAALDATVAEELVSSSERVALLRAYLRVCRSQRLSANRGLLFSAFRIYQRSRRLSRQRRIREMRQVPQRNVEQSLVWVDGERLCMTPSCQAELNGTVPDWLRLRNLPAQPSTYLTQ